MAAAEKKKGRFTCKIIKNNPRMQVVCDRNSEFRILGYEVEIEIEVEVEVEIGK